MLSTSKCYSFIGLVWFQYHCEILKKTTHRHIMTFIVLFFFISMTQISYIHMYYINACTTIFPLHFFVAKWISHWWLCHSPSSMNRQKWPSCLASSNESGTNYYWNIIQFNNSELSDWQRSCKLEWKNRTLCSSLHTCTFEVDMPFDFIIVRRKLNWEFPNWFDWSSNENMRL